MRFADLLSAYVKEETISEEIDNNIIEIAKSQSLLPLLYPITKNPNFKAYYISGALDDERFRNLKDFVTDLFNKNNIAHLYVKGAIIQEFYPDSAIRTRGDVEELVKEDDLSRARIILENNGFSEDKDSDCAHHIGYFKDGIELELHFRLWEDADGKEIGKVYNNAFAYSNIYKDMEYKMDDTYHFVFAIAHFARHLRYGAGLRYMLDFYYMMKKTNIDKELLHRLLKKFDLIVLYNNILNVIDVMFDFKYEDYMKKDINYFIDYMSSYGIHGNYHNDTHQTSVRKHKFRHFLNRVFLLDKAYRISRFPKMGKHWYLYPLCIILHTLYLIFNKLPKFFILLFKSNNRKKLYKDLGI